MVLFSLYLQGQHLNINFDIEFEVDNNVISESDEFDIEGEVTNITNTTLFGDVYLDFYVGTSVPSNFFNLVTLSDTIEVTDPIQPGDDIKFDLEEIDATDPLFNLQLNQQNIIIIWPRLGPGESGDSIQYYIDSIFVFPDTSGVFNENIVETQPLNVYPNPITDNLLHIDLTDLSMETYQLRIWNTLGQMLVDIPLEGGQINQLSTKGIRNGMLIAELINQKGIPIKQKRIILQSSQ